VGLRDEILEQPAAIERLLDAAPSAFAPIAAAVAARRPRFAVIAARGTSDNAGIYAQYLLAIRNGLSSPWRRRRSRSTVRQTWPTRWSSASQSGAHRTSSRWSKRRVDRAR
jgi:hypothetical protein